MVKAALWLVAATAGVCATTLVAAITARWQSADFPLADTLFALVLLLGDVADALHFATAGFQAAAAVATATAVAAAIAAWVAAAALVTADTGVCTAALVLLKAIEKGQSAAALGPWADNLRHTNLFFLDTPAVLFNFYFFNTRHAAIAAAVVAAVPAFATVVASAARFAAAVWFAAAARVGVVCLRYFGVLKLVLSPRWGR